MGCTSGEAMVWRWRRQGTEEVNSAEVEVEEGKLGRTSQSEDVRGVDGRTRVVVVGVQDRRSEEVLEEEVRSEGELIGLVRMSERK